MEVISSYLPSAGIGYEFESIHLNPMTFLEMTQYVEGTKDISPIERYFYDIRMLTHEDANILNCYIMDIDFLIFYKKLISVSGNSSLTITIQCPTCGATLKKEINLDTDIHFENIDEKIMAGALVELGGKRYETRVPRVKDLLKVFDVFKRYSRVNDLKMMKTISLFKDFDTKSQQIEKDVLGATRGDITVLLALRDLYFDRIEPVKIFCPNCNKGKPIEERRSVAVSVDSLIVDFFPAVTLNNGLDGSKILFKQVS
ncbi:MAG: hypothetical protein J6I84_04885 [Bacilli bacterium]|nr:hypothetical protein [Bacilli bacterium]